MKKENATIWPNFKGILAAPPRNKGLIRPYKGKPMVNKPLYNKALFPGGGGIGGGPLGSHD